MIWLVTFLAGLLLVCSLLGWGALVRRMAAMPGGDTAVTVVLGLASWLALGGLINLLGLAYGAVLDLTVVVGLGLLAWYRNSLSLARLRPGAQWVSWGLITLLVVCVIAFTIETQLRPAAFNYHDDFQKYFSHPVRMLQTGTLRAGPLSALGSQTLGGLAFLQAFVVNHFGVDFINAMDGVFGLLLCLALVAGTAHRRPALGVSGVLAVLLVAVINPQYVNVSALYLGSALMLAAILVTSDPRELGFEGQWQGEPKPLIMGLLYAGMIGLKPTFGLFAVLHLASLVVARVVLPEGRARSVGWGAQTAMWSLIFLAPWAGLHAHHYAAGLLGPGSSGGLVSEGDLDAFLASAPQSVYDPQRLLSTDRLSYGGSFALYSFAAAVALICAALAAWTAARRPPGADRIAAAAAAAGGFTGFAAYLIQVVVFGPLLSGYGTGLRYSVPFLLAAVPASILLADLHFGELRSRPWSRTLRALPLLLGGIALVSFGPPAWDRAKQGWQYGSILAFSWLAKNSAYLRYNEQVLSGGVRQRLADLQAKVPAGEPILAWVNAPFFLDRARNPIMELEYGATASPWASVPDAPYVLWEYSSFGTRLPQDYAALVSGPGENERRIAVTSLIVLRVFRNLVDASEVLYDDGSILLVRRRKQG